MSNAERRHQSRPVHPFPARMAPDLALESLRRLRSGSVVLDPMAGSGTVIRQAIDLGHEAIGLDSDPLAVLMAKVWTLPVGDASIGRAASDLLASVHDLKASDVYLPWIDDDAETTGFVNYWFAARQRNVLRRLAFALWWLDGGLSDATNHRAHDVLRLALSRIIITKDQGASLARDVSHSRPHRVAMTSDFDVLKAFERSINVVRERLAACARGGHARIHLGDARRMTRVAANSVDAVLTSPPYLNAIDYLRGHRMSLVWLGHSISELRAIRSGNIGSERAIDNAEEVSALADIEGTMCDVQTLSPRLQGIVHRYAKDVLCLLAEVGRVLKPGGQATFVVGNSCLKGTFINNANAVAAAADAAGLSATERSERELPDRHRYLPMPRDQGTALGKRMRTETILTFSA